MPKPRAVDKYPNQYFELLRALPHHGDDLSIDFPSNREAQAFRFDFYGFLDALRRAETHPELVLISDKYSIKIRNATVTFADVNRSSIANTLAEVLSAIPIDERFPPEALPGSPPGLSSEIQELRRKIEEEQGRDLSDNIVSQWWKAPVKEKDPNAKG